MCLYIGRSGCRGNRGKGRPRCRSAEGAKWVDVVPFLIVPCAQGVPWVGWGAAGWELFAGAPTLLHPHCKGDPRGCADQGLHTQKWEPP